MENKQPRVVVVTGASAGIGRAIAVEFAKQGSAVALLARGAEGLRGAENDVIAAGGRALQVQTDVSDPAQVEQAASIVEETLGPIDVWVNNAMVTVLSPAMEMQAEEYQRVTAVSYLGTVYGTLAAIRRMRPRNSGMIIQVGSALAYRAIPLQSAYCAAKFAVRGFTDSVRIELMRDKSSIHLTMVQLSAFNTPQFDWARHRMPARPMPLPPIFQPEVAARAVVWASTRRRREINVGFPAVKTIYGNGLAPVVGDYMALKQGFEGQQDQDAAPPADDRPDNLFDPVPRDFGIHGRFDDMSKDHSWQLWMTMHRPLVLGGLLVLIAIPVVLLFI